MDISKRRILRDTEQVVQTNRVMLEAQGIHYIPSDSCLHTGTALLIGRPDTPYFGGFYFFDITFPTDYPFSPIKVQTLTQDGHTRFNPNLYIQGKVCLSILNTWHDGPQWSGVQTLESVLLAILSDVLCANPLENEPAYARCGATAEAQMYNRLIWYANLQTAIYGHLLGEQPYSTPFRSIMMASFLTHAPAILQRATESAVDDGKKECCRAFSMSHTYDFKGLVEKLNQVKNLNTSIPPIDSAQ